jgi:PAS domain S-box-containing protein
VSGGSTIVAVLCGVHVAVAAAVVAWSLGRRAHERAAVAFAALIASEGLWSLGHLFETLAPTLGGKLAWDSLQTLPVAAIGVTSLGLARAYVSARRGRTALIVSAVAIGACALVVASAPLELIYARTSAHLVGDPPVLVYDYGLLDSAIAVFALIGCMTAAAVVVRRFAGEPSLLAPSSAALAVALAMPALGTLTAMAMGWHIDGDRDVSPVTFTLAALVAAWGLRRRLFDLTPIARDAVLAHLPDPVLVIDREARLIDANPAALALLDRPAREVLGQPAAAALARFPGLAAHTDGALEVAAGDRWYAAIARPLADRGGAALGRTLVLRDVTLQKQAHAMSEGRFRALFDQVVSLVGLLDPDGRVKAANRASLELVGAREDELRGVPFWDTPWWSHREEARALIKDAIARAAAGTPVQFQTEHVDREGRAHRIDFSLTPVRDASGAVVELIPEGRDVTALHEQHARAERLAEQLRQGQKLESIGRLAGGIAHDFNNLLTVIRGNADLVRLTARDPSALESIGEIVQASDAAAQITKQLLTFSRAQPVAPRPLDLADAIASCRKLLGRLLRADVQLRFDVPPGLWIEVDPTQLQQVVMNLALNAQDAMPGGGALAITAEACALDASAAEPLGARPGDYVRLCVADSGAGMDEVTRARVFEPFFTTKAEGRGTGLGLAVVHGVVYQAKGAIDVASAPGRGTTFSLYFPRAVAPGAAVAAPAPAALPASSAPRTIVLVEDQEALRRLIGRSLERSGYRVHAFASPDDVLARAATLVPRPDLLLTDVVLPRKNGVELAREAAALWPGLRVLFMSGYAAGMEHSAMASITEASLVAKPFTPDQLAQRIAEVLASQAAWEDAS